MIRVRNGRVTALLARRSGATEALVAVEPDGGEARALGYDDLVGPLEVGDRVVLNTTAVTLALGTGGFHLVMARLDGERDGEGSRGLKSEAPAQAPGGEAKPSVSPSVDLGPGHVMKARYTPAQVRVLAVEEEASPHRAAVADVTDLEGLPVVCAELHSMVPVAAAAARAVDGDLTVAYVMSDGAALPLAFSRLAGELRASGLVAGIVTAGQAFGGDLEAITLHSGLVSARAVLGADVVVAAQGPGGMGTGTALGYSGIQVAEMVNAAGALGGRPVACLRMSTADARERHRGVSHHSLTALGRLALARARVALPALADPSLAATVRRQLDGAGVSARHEIVPVDPPDAGKLLAAWGLQVRTMGRGPEDDPVFFAAAAAAGTLAGRLAAGGGGG